MCKISIAVSFLILSLSSIFTACSQDQKASTVAHQTQDVSVKMEKQSIVLVLKENADLSVKEQIALYYKLKAEHLEDYTFDNEDELNLYGYSFLWEDKAKDALEIFKLLVAEFPQSANTYDSLAEAYWVLGDADKALAYYEKSLVLNPENFNAQDQIDEIKNPGSKREKIMKKFTKVFPAQSYRDDLDEMGNKLMSIHPNALKFISKESFLKLIEHKKSLITEKTTYGAFAWHCSEIIASINCSHSSMGRFYQESDMLPVSLRFPAQVRWANKRLYVIDPLNNKSKLRVKDEILSINGVAVVDLMEDIYHHIASQAYVETTKKHYFNTWATAMIPYALGFPEHYELKISEKKALVPLAAAESFKNLFEDPSIAYCKEGLCFEILEDQETAMLRITTFNYYSWNNLQVFKDFMDTIFKRIEEKGVKNLVIDVRFNGGGSAASSMYLLRYLMDKPFIYYSKVAYEGKENLHEGETLQIPFENAFDGKLYFMMDGIGNSTTGHFMSIVKVNHLGTIVGEELGSNQFCSAGYKECRLSNTGLQYAVANNTHVSAATSLADETGILPDHYVTQTIDDYLMKKDVVKDFTLELIKQQTK